MLTEFQIINKILQDKDYGIIRRNGLTEDYFANYAAQFKFIDEHYKKNGNIPDTLTFLAKFQDFNLTEVNETESFLLDNLYEEYGFRKFNQFLPELGKKIQEDSRLAYDYLKDQMTNLRPHTVCKGIDIIANAMERYELLVKRANSEVPLSISTGFKELDDIFGGWEFGEELMTLVARTNAGKSWILMKFLAEAWKQGYRVGLYSGEMSHVKLGYRFDALFGHFSNRALVRGHTPDGYFEYIKQTKEVPNPFIIATQKEFGGQPNVNQLRNFVEENKLQILGIDQLSLMSDYRASKIDPPRMRLSHISEDLFALSSEYKIPILALAQANRAATDKDGHEAPGLENIKESDDIAHNSSKCIGMRQTSAGLVLDIIKNREGKVGDKLLYNWDIDIGEFTYIPSLGDAALPETRNDVMAKTDAKYSAVATANVANPFSNPF